VPTQLFDDYPITIPVYVNDDTFSTLEHIVSTIDEFVLKRYSSYEDIKKAIAEDEPYVVIANCEAKNSDDVLEDECFFAIVESYRSPFYIILTPGQEVSVALGYFRLGIGALLHTGFKTKEMREVLNLALLRTKHWKTSLDELLANKSFSKELDSMFDNLDTVSDDSDDDGKI
jgi:AmiR/NasT family two-component response regulator